METAAAAPTSSAPASTPSAPASTPEPSPTPSSGATAAPGSTPAPSTPKPEPKRYRLKVDGQEVEVDEDELQRGYARASSASKRFEEAAKLKKEIEAERAKLREKPWETMSEAFKADPRIAELAQARGIPHEDAAAILRVQDIMQREQMSPDQRALADERRRREDLEAKIKADEETKTKTQQDAETQVYIESLNREIPAAAEAVGLPRTPRVGNMVLEHQLKMAKAGVQFDARESAALVKEQLQTEFSGVLREFTDDGALAKFLGPDVVKRILKHSVSQQRGPMSPAPATVTPLAERQPNRLMTPDEWRKKYG